LVALALLIAVGASAGCGRSAPRGSLEGWNVLLVTLDTTRADRLGCYGHPEAETPVIDGLAARGVVFDQAAAQGPLTLPSHASMLTGLFPPSHGARGNGVYRLVDSQRTLAETLQEHGWQTAGVVASFVLERRFGLAQGFDRFDDFSPDMVRDTEFTYAHRRAASVTDAALRLASEIDPARPFFLWVHYFDPHAPYDAPSEIASRFPSTESGRYDAEIATMDLSIGRLLDGLERRGLLDRTIIAVVGDHGEGFPGPHAERTHGILLYEDTLRIPFLVAAPRGIEGGRRVGALVRQVDLTPTILDLLGLEDGAHLEGTSLAPLLRGEDPSYLDEIPSYGETLAPWDTYGWSPLFQVRVGRWKLVDGPDPELYDLASDPSESRNLAPELPDRADELRRILRGIRERGETAAAANASRSASASEVARLQAMGYFTPGVEPPPEDGFDGLGDPKERIRLQALLEDGRRLSIAGKPREAARKMEEVLREDEGNIEAWSQLALFLKAAGDLEGSERALAVLLDRHPDNRFFLGRAAEIRNLLARELEEEGRSAEARTMLDLAIATYRKAIEGEELDPAPIVNLGAIYLREDRLPEAEELFERACRIDRNSFEAHLNLAVARNRLERYAEAEAAAERALALAGEDREKRKVALLVKAEVLTRLGKDREAEACVRRLLEDYPDDPRVPSLRRRLEDLRRNGR